MVYTFDTIQRNVHLKCVHYNNVNYTSVKLILEKLDIYENFDM